MVRKAANSTLDLVHSIRLRAFDGFVALQESFWYLDNLHNAPTMVRNTSEQLLETLDSVLAFSDYIRSYFLLLSFFSKKARKRVIEPLGRSNPYISNQKAKRFAMLPPIILLGVLVLLSYPALFPVASFPLGNEALPSVDSLTVDSRPSGSANMSVGLGATILNDWENFAPTKQVLRGRVFTSQPIRPRALFFMIDGGIATTRHQISELGDACLRARDNPYAYMVPGCHFWMWSKTAKGSAAPVMTYRMMQEVFLALEDVLLQKDERDFETSLVLTDEDCVSWDHGEVFSVDVCTSNSLRPETCASAIGRPFIFASSGEIEESEEGEVVSP